jgi:hypothetical protein
VLVLLLLLMELRVVLVLVEEMGVELGRVLVGIVGFSRDVDL